jgi:hypothetical protein
MAYTLSQSAIPVFEIGLTALSGVLDKAAAFASAKKLDPSVLPGYRLAPDMFTLARQVQVACDQAKNGGSRLAGVEPPKYEDNEKTIDDLKARIAKTLGYVKSLDTAKIDASADREITFPLGPVNNAPRRRRGRQARFPRADSAQDDVRFSRVIASEAKQSPSTCSCASRGDCFVALRAPRNDALEMLSRHGCPHSRA